MLGVSSIIRETENTNASTGERNSSGSPLGQRTAPTIRPARGAESSGFEAPTLNYAKALLPWLTNELLFSTVLDIACGDGTAVDELNGAKYEAYGIDAAATADQNRRIMRGDLMNVPMETGFFDLVMCANTLHEIDDHRVPQALAEIHRLSNSYVILSVPSGETIAPNNARIRTPLWWCARIADFGWKIRLLREDPSTGQLVILAEKADSMAAKVLPQLDLEDSNHTTNGSTTTTTPTTRQDTPSATATNTAAPTATTTSAPAKSGPSIASQAMTQLDMVTDHLKADRVDAAYRGIVQLAETLGRTAKHSPQIIESLRRIVSHMEKKELGVLLFRLERELRPLLSTIN